MKKHFYKNILIVSGIVFPVLFLFLFSNFATAGLESSVIQGTLVDCPDGELVDCEELVDCNFCGEEPYDPKTQDCCNDVIHEKLENGICCEETGSYGPGDACCAGKPYDSATQVCCDDLMAYDKEEDGICCDGIYGPGDACCAGLPYYSKEMQCCPEVENSEEEAEGEKEEENTEDEEELPCCKDEASDSEGSGETSESQDENKVCKTKKTVHSGLWLASEQCEVIEEICEPKGCRVCKKEEKTEEKEEVKEEKPEEKKEEKEEKPEEEKKLIGPGGGGKGKGGAPNNGGGGMVNKLAWCCGSTPLGLRVSVPLEPAQTFDQRYKNAITAACNKVKRKPGFFCGSGGTGYKFLECDCRKKVENGQYYNVFNKTITMPSSWIKKEELIQNWTPLNMEKDSPISQTCECSRGTIQHNFEACVGKLKNIRQSFLNVKAANMHFKFIGSNQRRNVTTGNVIIPLRDENGKSTGKYRIHLPMEHCHDDVYDGSEDTNKYPNLNVNKGKGIQAIQGKEYQVGQVVYDVFDVEGSIVKNATREYLDLPGFGDWTEEELKKIGSFGKRYSLTTTPEYDQYKQEYDALTPEIERLQESINAIEEIIEKNPSPAVLTELNANRRELDSYVIEQERLTKQMEAEKDKLDKEKKDIETEVNKLVSQMTNDGLSDQAIFEACAKYWNGFYHVKDNGKDKKYGVGKKTIDGEVQWVGKEEDKNNNPRNGGINRVNDKNAICKERECPIRRCGCTQRDGNGIFITPYGSKDGSCCYSELSTVLTWYKGGQKGVLPNETLKQLECNDCTDIYEIRNKIAHDRNLTDLKDEKNKFLDSKRIEGCPQDICCNALQEGQELINAKGEPLKITNVEVKGKRGGARYCNRVCCEDLAGCTWRPMTDEEKKAALGKDDELRKWDLIFTPDTGGVCECPKGYEYDKATCNTECEVGYQDLCTDKKTGKRRQGRFPDAEGKSHDCNGRRPICLTCDSIPDSDPAAPAEPAPTATPAPLPPTVEPAPTATPATPSTTVEPDSATPTDFDAPTVSADSGG